MGTFIQHCDSVCLDCQKSLILNGFFYGYGETNNECQDKMFNDYQKHIIKDQNFTISLEPKNSRVAL